MIVSVKTVISGSVFVMESVVGASGAALFIGLSDEVIGLLGSAVVGVTGDFFPDRVVFSVGDLKF